MADHNYGNYTKIEKVGEGEADMFTAAQHGWLKPRGR